MDIRKLKKVALTRIMVTPPSPGEVLLYVNDIFAVRVKSKKSVGKIKILFEVLRGRVPLQLFTYMHGGKDLDVDCVITWRNMPPYLHMNVCEYVMHLKSIS